MIIVDVETTGLRPVDDYSILSIGALDFDNPSNQFYEECRIRDGAKIESKALEVNGFKLEEIIESSRQSIESMLSHFLVWSNSVKNRVLAGDNTSFDRDYLEYNAKRYGIEWTLPFRVIDLYTSFYVDHLRRGINPPTPKQGEHIPTDRILHYVGLPAEPKPHHALTGAKIEAEAFSRLIYGTSRLEEFKSYPLPTYLK